MTCGFRKTAGESAVSGAVDLEFRREKKKKRTEKTSRNGFKRGPTVCRPEGVRDPERKRAGKRGGRAARAAMSTRRTLRSLEALPASSRTSAVRYSAVHESGRER